jgi:hypothetical protein
MIKIRALGDPSPPLPHTYSSGKEGHWKGWAVKLMYIKLPMYLFFYMTLGLNDLVGTDPLLGPLERVGRENLDFLGPASIHLGPKKSRFSGPTPSSCSCNGFARIKINTSRALKVTQVIYDL